jgi:hypothetical protein
MNVVGHRVGTVMTGRHATAVIAHRATFEIGHRVTIAALAEVGARPRSSAFRAPRVKDGNGRSVANG